MATLLDSNTRVLVQGLGRDGSFQTKRMLEYGTNIVAAVHPGRGGAKFEDKIPYFETVNEAVQKTAANCGVIFVPALAAPDAIVEQIDGGIRLIVCITEGIPVRDMVKVKYYLRHKKTAAGQPVRLIGPNCPGIIHPASKTKVGIIPGSIVSAGNVGVVSRSGTMTYEAIAQLGEHGYGQSTCIGIGGDSVVGTVFTDALELFEKDDETRAIVLIGEIGGDREQQAAAYIASAVSKLVVAYIAGQSAPKGKRMGHAGAIISGKSGTATAKIEALKQAGAHIAEIPTMIGAKIKEVLG